MMNAYFFQMNNLKGLAADKSKNSVGRETSQVRQFHSQSLCKLDFLSSGRDGEEELCVHTCVLRGGEGGSSGQQSIELHMSSESHIKAAGMIIYVKI